MFFSAVNVVCHKKKGADIHFIDTFSDKYILNESEILFALCDDSKASIHHTTMNNKTIPHDTPNDIDVYMSARASADNI